ncbi:hypothetical protein [Galactobacter valiniphilus]|uniref:hypothetical protein n=1 Tax=Galactobacter valiniphilus TaxID=2676122 RepID=UPI003735430B
MGITVDALLAGPRGRRACLATAIAVEASHTPPIEEGVCSALPLEVAERRADQAYATSSGTRYLIAFEEGTRRTRRERKRARRAVDAEEAELRARASSTIAPLAEALDAVAADVLDHASPGGLSEETLNVAVMQSVDSSRMWQDPEGIDIPLTLPELRRALRPFAEAIARSPASAWWDRELALDDQWLALRDENHLEGLAASGPPEQIWDGWRRGRLHNEERGDRSLWWSMPATGDLARTHGTFSSGLPTVAVWEEDGEGWYEGLSAVRVVVPGAPRVFEVRCASDWALLCGKYPFVLTRSVGQRLRAGVGPDPVRGAGDWVIPEWSAVARDYDAVHLSVSAYLSCTDALIDIPGLGASAIAGWDPDETYWLGRLPNQGVPSSTNGRLKHWALTDTGDFAEASDPA